MHWRDVSMADFASRIDTEEANIPYLGVEISWYFIFKALKTEMDLWGLCFEIKISQMMYTHQLFYCLLC